MEHAGYIITGVFAAGLFAMWLATAVADFVASLLRVKVEE